MERIIDSYKDYKECGVWGTFDTETKESVTQGKMYSQTIKVANSDGSISLETIWVPDFELKDEL